MPLVEAGSSNRCSSARQSDSSRSTPTPAPAPAPMCELWFTTATRCHLRTFLVIQLGAQLTDCIPPRLISCTMFCFSAKTGKESDAVRGSRLSARPLPDLPDEHSAASSTLRQAEHRMGTDSAQWPTKGAAACPVLACFRRAGSGARGPRSEAWTVYPRVMPLWMHAGRPISRWPRCSSGLPAISFRFELCRQLTLSVGLHRVSLLVLLHPFAAA